VQRWTTTRRIVLLVIAVLVVVVGVQVAVTLPRDDAPLAVPTVDWAASPIGADASWPGCTPPHGTKHTLPLAPRPAFAVVGVNDGLPGTRSACVERELRWSDTATGGSSQPRLAYYVMAADPWAKAELRWVHKPVWPSSNRLGSIDVAVPAAYASKQHGTTCSGGHTERACAYVYGWSMAQADAALPGLRSPATHRFWIDVEARQDWSRDTLYNQAVVEGMVAAFTAPVAAGGIGTTPGIYSDHGEWSPIVGALRAGSPIDPLDEWLAIGTASPAKAIDALRHETPLTTGGRVRMIQYLDGAYDRDVAAPG
jgi:hypothetical protein